MINMVDIYKRLDENITPLNYNLIFKPDFKTFTFLGDEQISINLSDKTDKIRLNSKEIEITKALLIKDNKEFKVTYKVDKLDETVTFKLPKKMIGLVKLILNFKGKNNDQMYGFYKSSYIEKGKEKYLLSSQFEPSDARAAFPCFDEPNFKATFDISFIINQSLEAVSNMPIKSSIKRSKGMKLVTFKTTPLMSTYLVYLGVGDFESVSGKVGNLPLRVLTIPGKKVYAKLALEYTKKFLSFYFKYFNIDYPLPKMDLIAVPDFSAGAMENWGAITFRDTAIFATNKSSSITKERVSITIAHELAHQWFGDLVTMKWWDDLWLNESFATFMSYKAVDATLPDIGVKYQFYENEIKDALFYDQLKNTHPISVKVESPAKINSIFDVISYEKGSSVLSMIEDYLGAETFRQGLIEYINSHIYSNTTKEDLWYSLDKAAKDRHINSDVKGMIKNWITKGGYPLVMVSKNKNLVKLEQKRFLLDNDKSTNIKWDIPIRYNLIGDKSIKYKMLKDRVDKIEDVKGKPFKLNYQQKGIYRVMYDKPSLEAICEEIKSGKLNGIDEWGIVNDLYNFVRSGNITLDYYFELIKKYLYNVSYPANNLLLDSLNVINTLAYKDKGNKKIEEIMLWYLEKQYKKYNWDFVPKNDTDDIFRLNVLYNLGLLGYKPIVKKARDLFKNIKSVSPTLTSAVYSIIALNGGETEFKQLMELYKKEMVQEESLKLLISLGLFKNEKIDKEALDFSFSKNVKLQNSYVIPSIMSGNIASNTVKHFIGNPYGKKVVWEWIKDNWSKIEKVYSPNSSFRTSLFKNLELVSDPVILKDVEDFFRVNKPSEVIALQVAKSMELMRININFIKRNKL